MITASAHGGSGDDVWTIVILVWLFGGGALEGIAETFGVGLSGLRRRSRRRHKRKMERLALELKIARAKAGGTAGLPSAAIAVAPRPGPCAHRRVVPVIPAGEDKPAAWLCKNCDTRLPADWAVREEDL
jgi:hypothetical protein